MFAFKKIVANFFFPLPIVVFIFGVGLILLWFTRKQKAGKIILTLAFALLVLFSNGYFADLLIKPFEMQYSPADAQLAQKKETVGKYPVKYVVVLGGGISTGLGLPVTSFQSSESLVRLVEGIRLQRFFPDSKLVPSGGSVYEKISEAEVAADIAEDLGVDHKDIIIEDKSRDTKDQAKLIKSIVGNDLFVLVTSASHMPRSMAMFEKQGMNPIPAPAGHLYKAGHSLSFRRLFPNAGSLRKTEKAFYETLGYTWAKLRGQI